MEPNEKDKMTPQQKLEYARMALEISREGTITSSRRGSELSDEFNRLEVQMATIIFTFASLVVRFFEEGTQQFADPILITIANLAYVCSIFFLLISLVLGLLHIKRKEVFWDNVMTSRVARVEKWDEVIRGEAAFEEGRAFQQGTNLGGRAVVLRSPSWTWILQTIFLGLGVFILFVLFVVILIS